MTKAGLIGVYKTPTLRSNNTSVYMISDESAHILFVFVLFPGAYQDAYEIASKEMYPNVIIVPVLLVLPITSASITFFPPSLN